MAVVSDLFRPCIEIFIGKAISKDSTEFERAGKGIPHESGRGVHIII